MNIIQQQELLKDLSDQDIAGEMQRPSGNVPLYLVAGEAKRRADLRERFKAEQSGPPPTSTVQEDLLSNIMASQMPATGIAQGMPQRQMPMAPPQQMAMAPQPQQMAMAPQPQQMPAIAPTGEAPMNQIPQAQGIMAGQQGGMAQGFAGGGLVREDRKYQDPQGAIVGINPYISGGLFNPTPVARRDSSGAQAFANLKAQQKANILAYNAKKQKEREDREYARDYDPAMAFLYKDVDANSFGSFGELDPQIVTTNPRDGSIVVSRASDPKPEPNTGDLTLSSDISNMGNQPLDTNATFNSTLPLTADEIARGTDFRGLRDTNKDIKSNRDAMLNLKLGKNPINFDPGRASALKVDQIDPALYKGVDPINIQPRGTVANPTQNKFNKLKLDEIRKRELEAIRNANVDPYKNMVTRLAERRAALDEDKSGNVAQTLMDLGGRIMAGKSQYGLTNIGEAVSPALKAAQDRKSGQTAREDALLASEMGIISGQRSFDKDLRAQANTIVQDRLKENEMINKETARANAQAVDNYNRDVIEEDKEYADNRFLAVQKKNDQKYNTTQKINLQQARIAEQVRAKLADQAEINRMANSTNAERRDEARKLQQNLDRELRILQLRGQSLSESKNDIIRRQEQRDTKEFRREILGKTQDFTAKENKLNRQAKKDAPAPLIKAFNQANDLPEGTPQEKAFKERIFGAIDGSTKAKRSAIASATRSFNDKYTKWVQERGTPRNAAEWKEAEEGLGLDSVSRALLALQKQRVMGGSGGPANNATGRGKPAYRQVK
mgnify:FL=1|tara:strand:+ start:2925 stop:5267 length:2343 start_codon:yes stop_codon:yes gene_type:complete